MAALNLNLSSILPRRGDANAKISRSQFRLIANDNPDMKLERDKQGNLIVITPTGGDRFANGNATRTPDVAWIPLAKWEALTPEERRGFLPLCPDFAVELMSRSDSWVQTQAKMVEYMESGCRSAWLLDPKGKRAVIYRMGQQPELLTAPESLSGEDVLPGFVLDARFLWI
jgi:Putative restriction endonuclease